MILRDKNLGIVYSDDVISRIRQLKHLALDMDGTIYNGGTLFPFTVGFLQRLKELGIGYSFLTNNPSKSTDDYLLHLSEMGISATAEEFYTSAQATIDYLHLHHPEMHRLFILGTPSMIRQFEQAGFVSTADNPSDEPDAVVVAFDMTLVYSRLCRAAWWISQGKYYVATNPDRVCPTDQPVVLVDCGSICKCLEHATGRKPDIVLGKPDPNMLTGIKERFGLAADEIAMVGDRIYTDVAMAHNAGAMGVLVLSGETTEEVAAAADPQPHITALSLKEFGEDKTIDTLIRKYGYKGTPHTLEATAANKDLQDNLGASAHLIHGSSEGRFTITYCPGPEMTREEIEGVGFNYGVLDEVLARYPLDKLKDGWNTMPDGEEVYYISNPALGLWAYPGRFKD